MIEILEYDGQVVNEESKDMLSCYMEQETFTKTKRVSNTDRIVQYMKEHGVEGITSKQAFEMFGVTRLAAIIFNLRHKRKMNIISEDTSGYNRFGAPVTFTTYVLQEEE